MKRAKAGKMKQDDRQPRGVSDEAWAVTARFVYWFISNDSWNGKPTSRQRLASAIDKAFKEPRAVARARGGRG